MQQLQLITALGKKTDLVLQLVDFLNGNPQYRYNEEASSVRRRFTGQKITDLHLVLTKEVAETERALRNQLALEYPEVQIHPLTLPCDDIACIEDDETMRQLIYEKVASLAGRNLIISSAGRKTITNRLIEAGMIYGCFGYLTLTAPGDKEKRECSESFHALWTPTRSFLAERQQSWIKDEMGKNFRSLYLLPTTILDRLRQEKIGATPDTMETTRQWLEKLPPRRSLRRPAAENHGGRTPRRLPGRCGKNQRNPRSPGSKHRRPLGATVGGSSASPSPENASNQPLSDGS